MGNSLSFLRNQRNGIPSTISYFTNSFGLYFGPYFIMNRNNRTTNTRARNLINEQVQNNIMTSTGLMWSDLLEAIENGVITEQELSDFGISFGQTHISEYDAPITIQSLVNLHKHSIKLSKVKYEGNNHNRNSIYNMAAENLNFNMENNSMSMGEKKNECVIQIENLSNNDNKDDRVNLEFEYDSYTPCQVHLFWNAREVIVKNGNERKAIYLLNHNENRNSMTIGPLPAGNNKKFVLPGVIDIPASVVDEIINQTNKNSNNLDKKNNVKKSNGEIPNRENNTPETENSIDVNTREGIVDSELSNASASDFRVDNNTSSTEGTRTRRSIFRNGSRNSSRSNSRSKKDSKKDSKERKIIWYPLIIVLEALEKKSTDNKINDHTIKYQTTFLKLEINTENEQYNIKSIDQKVMIKNNLYRLQEIYGFTDINDAEQVVTNEVNCSIECVICLSEPRNTVVLPCRHLCVCQDCADILCNQSRQDSRSSYLSTPRCPICRQIFHSFLRINMDYFNLAEESLEKNGSMDNIALAKCKGKKDNIDSPPEMKYDIIATSRMNDDDVDEQLNKSIFDNSEQKLQIDQPLQEPIIEEINETKQTSYTSKSIDKLNHNNIDDKCENNEKSIEVQDTTETIEDSPQSKDNEPNHNITAEEGSSSNNLNIKEPSMESLD
ncbi:hypothetical protein BCR36DRAFT_412664 [Piromyces finnis]|uniref:RING-type domain-containing protein n=1 Tax=Piromyces finnis TaxID=1754191 RepID=A0A1Y1V8J3_9FUNG|nr:hypothetical protein BCR36DRAFT_412664 [Piromyces finnis]|eukprot:ORX49690.1 hypothetical protein BCR36DRAFT_412664 [Piromyces finnis]